MSEIIKSTLLLITSVLFSILILEVGLRTATPFPNGDARNIVSDSELGYVMNKSVTSIDKQGFRNPADNRKISVVAIGDSQTYGYNADSEHAWPRALEKSLHVRVYNFGVGGYGLLQYKKLSERALALNPDSILIGLYLPNDMNDVCRSILQFPNWQHWALENHYDVSVCPQTNKLAVDHEITLSRWYRTETAIGSLQTYFEDQQRARHQLHLGYGKEFFAAKNLPSETLFSVDRFEHLVDYMNPDAPDIQKALLLFEEITKDLKRDADAKKIHVGVIFTPSKESVYELHFKNAAIKPPQGYYQEIEHERALQAKAQKILDDAGVKWVIVQPDLTQLVMSQANIYPPGYDDHPLAAGYAAYASAAERLVKSF